MTTVALAGGTGNMGGRIAIVLRASGTEVRALVRRGSGPCAMTRLRGLGCEVIPVDAESVSDMTEALRGTDVVVSALSGVRDVIADL